MPALRNRDRSNSIVSPTPRPFSFPATHNLNALNDSPPTSPSSSPFEPELFPITTQQSLSPPSSPPPTSPSKSNLPTSPISPVAKKGDSNYIKRPENAFILFRRKCVEERSQPLDTSNDKTKKPRQADLSKSISQQWKTLPKVDRQYWEDLAKEKKKEHEAMYPGYVYRPQRARDKDGNVKPRKPRGSRIKEKLEKARHEAEANNTTTDASSPVLESSPSSLSIVIPTNYRHPRSLSLPTPPSSNQVIEIPTVYNASSCPGTPTRDCAPGHEYVKGTSTMSDEVVDWSSMKGDGFMPWSQPQTFSWHQPQFYGSDGDIPLQPSFFPLETDFSFNGNNSIPAASPHLLPAFNPYSSDTTTTCDPMSSFPSFDFDGADPSFKFGVPVNVDLSQSLAHASMVWEQANPVWGPTSAQFDFDMWSQQQQQEQESGGWGLDAVPSIQLGLPPGEGETTPTATSTRASLTL